MRFAPLAAMPASSVREWLDRELELRGIDAVIYTRYILSILQQDTVNFEPQERDLFPVGSGKKRDPCIGKGKGLKCKQRVNNTKMKFADCEEMKKSAAVECLLSASEQKSGIEELVDELCSRLKSIQCEGYTNNPNSSVVDEGTGQVKDSSFVQTSPEELAKKYYAAFPALSGKLHARDDVSSFPSYSMQYNTFWDGKKLLLSTACDADGISHLGDKIEDLEKSIALRKMDCVPKVPGDPTTTTTVTDKRVDSRPAKHFITKVPHIHHHAHHQHQHHHHQHVKQAKFGREQVGGCKPSFIVPKCKYRMLKQRVPLFKGKLPFSAPELKLKRLVLNDAKLNARSPCEPYFRSNKFDDFEIGYDSSFEDGDAEEPQAGKDNGYLVERDVEGAATVSQGGRAIDANGQDVEDSITMLANGQGRTVANGQDIAVAVVQVVEDSIMMATNGQGRAARIGQGRTVANGQHIAAKIRRGKSVAVGGNVEDSVMMVMNGQGKAIAIDEVVEDSIMMAANDQERAATTGLGSAVANGRVRAVVNGQCRVVAIGQDRAAAIGQGRAVTNGLDVEDSLTAAIGKDIANEIHLGKAVTIGQDVEGSVTATDNRGKVVANGLDNPVAIGYCNVGGIIAVEEKQEKCLNGREDGRVDVSEYSCCAEDSEILHKLESKFNDDLASIWSNRDLIDSPIDKLSQMLETAFKTSLSTWITKLKTSDGGGDGNGDAFVLDMYAPGGKMMAAVDYYLDATANENAPESTNGQQFIVRSLESELGKVDWAQSAVQDAHSRHQQEQNRIWQCGNRKQNFIKGGVYGYEEHQPDAKEAALSEPDLYEMGKDGSTTESPTFDSDSESVMDGHGGWIGGSGPEVSAIRENELKIIVEILGAIGGCESDNGFGKLPLYSEEIREEAVDSKCRDDNVWEPLEQCYDLWDREPASCGVGDWDHRPDADQSMALSELSMRWNGNFSLLQAKDLCGFGSESDSYNSLSTSFCWGGEESYRQSFWDIWRDDGRKGNSCGMSIIEALLACTGAAASSQNEHLSMTRSYDSYLNKGVAEDGDVESDFLSRAQDQLLHQSDPALFGRKSTLTNHKGDSLFVQVKQRRDEHGATRRSSSAAFCGKVDNDGSNGEYITKLTDGGILIADASIGMMDADKTFINKTEEDSIEVGFEEENLLTSPKTHFRPIRPMSRDSDADSASSCEAAVAECAAMTADDDTAKVQGEDTAEYVRSDATSCGKPVFTQDENGIFHLSSDSAGGEHSSQLYMFYKGQEVPATAAAAVRKREETVPAFVPKFKLRPDLEKFCQTEDNVMSPEETTLLRDIFDARKPRLGFGVGRDPCCQNGIATKHEDSKTYEDRRCPHGNTFKQFGNPHHCLDGNAFKLEASMSSSPPQQQHVLQDAIGHKTSGAQHCPNGKDPKPYNVDFVTPHRLPEESITRLCQISSAFKELIEEEDLGPSATSEPEYPFVSLDKDLGFILGFRPNELDAMRSKKYDGMSATLWSAGDIDDNSGGDGDDASWPTNEFNGSNDLDEQDFWAVSDREDDNAEKAGCDGLMSMKEEIKQEEKELFEDINQMRELDLHNEWSEGVDGCGDYLAEAHNTKGGDGCKDGLQWPSQEDLYQEVMLECQEDEDCPELEMINGRQCDPISPDCGKDVDDDGCWTNGGIDRCEEAEDCAGVGLELDSFKAQDASGSSGSGKHHLSMIPTGKIVYSSDLEEEWMKHGKPFDVQVPKRQFLKAKLRSQRRPCTFYMDGNCRRTDCKFSHDLASITCRFWEEGSCFKGITCPFLHGYPRKHDSLRASSKAKDFHLESESDFPSLSKSADSTSSGGWMASAFSAKRKRKRNRPRHHSSSTADSDSVKCKIVESDKA